MSGGIAQAERVVKSTYGDTVSAEQKAKNLYKFGRNSSVGASFATIAQFQGSEANETYVATNLVNSAVSSSASDTTQAIVIEGHTLDGSGNLSFVRQQVSLTGQTPAILATPVARANRAYVAASGTFNSPPAELVGTVSIYDGTDGTTAGVPVTDAAVKLIIGAGNTNTEKAATSISATDYWFVTHYSIAPGDSSNNSGYVISRVQVRDVANGGPWRALGRDVALFPNQRGVTLNFDPYLIIPKNNDMRVQAKTDAGAVELTVEVGGLLAGIVT